MGAPITRQIRIAVVDDDRHVRDVVCDVLACDGYLAEPFANAEDLVLRLDRMPSLDLIILDLQLPDGDGFAVAAQVRATSSVPIIMLTSRSGDIDRIMGLEIGADDYVVKPFNTRELLARIKAVRRRFAPPPPRLQKALSKGIRFAGYVFDPERRRLTAPDGSPVMLTSAELDLLGVFLERRGRVLSREQLLDLTHRVNDNVFDRTIDVLVLRLRRKIEPNPVNPCLIRTERGHGYIFDVAVEAD